MFKKIWENLFCKLYSYIIVGLLSLCVCNKYLSKNGCMYINSVNLNWHYLALLTTEPKILNIMDNIMISQLKKNICQIMKIIRNRSMPMISERWCNIIVHPSQLFCSWPFVSEREFAAL